MHTVSQWSKQINEGAVLLTVNQRLCRYHEEQYRQWQLASGSVWWDTPAILPFRSWMTSLHRQALGLGLTTRSLAPALVVQQAWRHIIDSDDSVQLLDPTGATRAALSAWDLSCAWQCYNQEDHYLSTDQFTWQRWMTRYTAWLEKQQSIDEAMLPGEILYILERADDDQRAALLPEHLILDGFIQLPVQLEALVGTIESYGTTVHRHQPIAGAVVHDLLHEDDDAELLVIATHMRVELEHNSEQSLGLVIPDLASRRDAVVRAFERVFYPGMSPSEIASHVPAFEISLGSSLAEQPVVAAALKFLQLSGASISGSDISAVLLSPYWKEADTEERRREQQDRRWRDKRISTLSLQQFMTELDKGSRLGPVLKQLAAKRRMDQTHLSEWASRFSQWLGLLGWPGKARDTVEHQGFSAWHECLDDMQLLDQGRKVSFAMALGQLTALAKERVFQVESVTAPIQVMGRLESHGLAFDCLWVAGLDNTQWPPTGSPSAFLSIQQQKLCAIPASSAALRLELAEKEFALWASQAPLIFASSVQTREGNEMSRAALPPVQSTASSQALAEPIIKRFLQLLAPVDPLKTVNRALTCEFVDDFFGPALEHGTKVRGGARLFENQALCPFKAFALHRLGIRPLEEVGIGLDPRQHGTLLHAALEEFWKMTRTHTALMAMDEEQLHDCLQGIVAQCIVDYEVPSELQALEQIRLSRLLYEWITQMEVPREPFEVVELEQKLSIEHGGIRMDIIIDRIDRVGEALVVVDYKTGVNNRINTWADPRISNPQLPLYVLTDTDIGAASFAQVASHQCKYIGIASQSDILPKVGTKLGAGRKSADAPVALEQWEDWRDHWKFSLDAIASEIIQGVATVSPMKNACTYCELKPLCRISSVESELNDELSLGETVVGEVLI